MNETEIKLELPASLQYLNVAGAVIQAIIERMPGVSDQESVTYNLQLVLQELCTNIVLYAYKEDAQKTIKLLFRYSQDKFEVETFDVGLSFNPDAVQQPDLDDVQVHGYGLFLIQELMDEVVYQPQSPGNHWRLVKYLA